MQVDVHEVVPSSFWNNAQACLPAIEAGYLDSVRLRHFRDDREWAGFEDVDRRAGGLVDMRLFSYPRDILYSRMCPDRGVIWAAFEGTEVMNQLLGARAVIASTASAGTSVRTCRASAWLVRATPWSGRFEVRPRTFVRGTSR